MKMAREGCLRQPSADRWSRPVLQSQLNGPAAFFDRPPLANNELSTDMMDG